MTNLPHHLAGHHAQIMKPYALLNGSIVFEIWLCQMTIVSGKWRCQMVGLPCHLGRHQISLPWDWVGVCRDIRTVAPWAASGEKGWWDFFFSVKEKLSPNWTGKPLHPVMWIMKAPLERKHVPRLESMAFPVLWAALLLHQKHLTTYK